MSIINAASRSSIQITENGIAPVLRNEMPQKQKRRAERKTPNWQRAAIMTRSKAAIMKTRESATEVCSENPESITERVDEQVSSSYEEHTAAITGSCSLEVPNGAAKDMGCGLERSCTSDEAVFFPAGNPDDSSPPYSRASKHVCGEVRDFRSSMEFLPIHSEAEKQRLRSELGTNFSEEVSWEIKGVTVKIEIDNNEAEVGIRLLVKDHTNNRTMLATDKVVQWLTGLKSQEEVEKRAKQRSLVSFLS